MRYLYSPSSKHGLPFALQNCKCWLVILVCLLGSWHFSVAAQPSPTVEDVLRKNEQNIRDAQKREVPEADVFLQPKDLLPEKKSQG